MSTRTIEIHFDESFWTDEEVQSADIVTFVSADKREVPATEGEALSLQVETGQKWLLQVAKHGTKSVYSLLLTDSTLGERIVFAVDNGLSLIDAKYTLLLRAEDSDGAALESLIWEWHLSGMSALPEIEAPSFICKLSLLDGEKLTNVDFLTKLTTLTELDLAFCESMTNVDGLVSLSGLTSLSLFDCKSLRNVEGLSNLTDLIELSLSRCNLLTNVDSLSNLTNLTVLNLSWCDSLTNVDALANLTDLTELDLSLCNSLTDVSGLAGLSSLTKLQLTGCKSLRSIDGLANLTSLRELGLSDCKSLNKFDILASLTGLSKLNLSWNVSLSNVNVLANMASLTSLHLCCCKSLVFLDALANLADLTRLDLSLCPYVTDLSPLLQCKNLGDLDFDHIPKKIRLLCDNFRIHGRTEILQEKTDSFLQKLSTAPENNPALEAMAKAFAIVDDPAWVVEKLAELLKLAAVNGLAGDVLRASLETLTLQPFNESVANLIDNTLIAEKKATADLVAQITGALPVLPQFPVETHSRAIDLVKRLLRPVREGQILLDEVGPIIISFYAQMNQDDEVDFWLQKILHKEGDISLKDESILRLARVKLTNGEADEALAIGKQLTSDDARNRLGVDLFDFYCANQPEKAGGVLQNLTDAALKKASALKLMESSSAKSPQNLFTLLMTLQGDREAMGKLVTAVPELSEMFVSPGETASFDPLSIWDELKKDLLDASLLNRRQMEKLEESEPDVLVKSWKEWLRGMLIERLIDADYLVPEDRELLREKN